MMNGNGALRAFTLAVWSSMFMPSNSSSNDESMWGLYLQTNCPLASRIACKSLSFLI